MMHEPISYSAAFLIGLLGGAHCIGMCGGIMGALAFSVPINKRPITKIVPILLAFNLGRILSYTLAGAFVGILAWLVTDQFHQASLILRYLASLMLILLGLYLAGWSGLLRRLEHIGGKLWSLLQPIMKQLMPVNTPLQAIPIGMLWGWVPCGLVYSTLIWAATAEEWRQSALIMFFFGLGTLPTLMTTGLLLEKVKWLMRSHGFRRSAAVLIIIFGIWTIPIHWRDSGEQPITPHMHHSLKPAPDWDTILSVYSRYQDTQPSGLWQHLAFVRVLDKGKMHK